MPRNLIRSSLIAIAALHLAACSTYSATVGALGDTVDAVGETLTRKPPPQPVPNVDLTNAKWQKLSPAQPDANPLRVAIVARDEQLGATRVVIKAPPNFPLPAYWLSAQGHYTVLKGTFVFEGVTAGGEPQTLTQEPGAFAHVPPNLIQRASTLPGEEGLLYITVYGDWSPNFAQGAWTAPTLSAGR